MIFCISDLPNSMSQNVVFCHRIQLLHLVFIPCLSLPHRLLAHRISSPHGKEDGNGHILPPLFLCRLLTVILKPLAPPSLSSTGEQMFDAPPPFLSLTTNDQRPSQQKVLAQHCHLLASAMIIGKWCQSYYIICIANEPASIFT